MTDYTLKAWTFAWVNSITSGFYFILQRLLWFRFLVWVQSVKLQNLFNNIIYSRHAAVVVIMNIWYFDVLIFLTYCSIAQGIWTDENKDKIKMFFICHFLFALKASFICFARLLHRAVEKLIWIYQNEIS